MDPLRALLLRLLVEVSTTLSLDPVMVSLFCQEQGLEN
jgi:hypothetical protein